MVLLSATWLIQLSRREEAGKIAFSVWDALAKLESESALKVRTLLSFGLVSILKLYTLDIYTETFKITDFGLPPALGSFTFIVIFNELRRLY